MRSTKERSAAKTIADVLAGSWRSALPPLGVADDALEAAVPLAARTNAGALIWWRLRQTPFASSDVLETLHDAYRYFALQSALHEISVLDVLRRLRTESIEPILIKGWNLARLYPLPGLRPYEDIDLIVRPRDLARAQAAIEAAGPTEAMIDFDHLEIHTLDRPDWDGLYERSGTVRLGADAVRVLSPEDHLRVICIHSLKHCFSNPLWLCDIAVSVESAEPGFDWDRCFGNRAPQNQWIGCAIGLARELLACELPLEAAKRVDRIPRWLAPKVFDTWIDWAVAGKDERPLAIRELLDNPARFLDVIARRWPNQVEVCLARGAPLTENSAFAQRMHEFAHLFAPKRLTQAVARLPAALR